MRGKHSCGYVAIRQNYRLISIGSLSGSALFFSIYSTLYIDKTVQITIIKLCLDKHNNVNTYI